MRTNGLTDTDRGVPEPKKGKDNAQNMETDVMAAGPSRGGTPSVIAKTSEKTRGNPSEGEPDAKKKRAGDMTWAEVVRSGIEPLPKFQSERDEFEKGSKLEILKLIHSINL